MFITSEGLSAWLRINRLHTSLAMALMLARMHSLKKGAALKSLWAVFTLLCSHITQGSHLSLCWHSVSALLFRCSCVLLFSQDGWGTPFTWAESGPDDSAIPWVNRFTCSHGPHYHTQELHILIEECVKCTICVCVRVCVLHDRMALYHFLFPLRWRRASSKSR